MKKRILALATAVIMCISLMGMTVSAATVSMTGMLSNGKLTVTVTGLASGVAQVEILATSKSDSTDYRLDTATVSNSTATITFTVSGTDYIINATPKGSDGQDQTALTAIEVNGPVSTGVHVTYSTQVQTYGWQTAVSDGETAGTVGKSKRLEAIKINISGADLPAGASIKYKVQVQTFGWQAVVSNGALSGTVNKAKRLEAIKITLNGMPGYEVQYKVQVQSLGWQKDWSTTPNGTAIDSATLAGTVGKAKRLEAIMIQIVPV